MATVFERWAQTARELKAAKATPEQAEAAREELRRRFVEKMEEAKLDPATRAVALSRFESGTNALSVKHGLKKEVDPLTEDERYALEHPVLGGITQAGKEVVAPLAQGVQRIAGGAARLLNDIGDNEKGTVLDRFANNMDDAQKSVDDWAGQGYAEADGVRGFAKSALQNAPQIALSLLPGAALGKAASLAKAAKGAQAGDKVLKYGMPVAAGLSFGQNYAGEYGDARKQTEDKLAKATPDDLRASNVYGSDFKSLERKFFDDGMSADDAATAARDALVDSIAERRADAAAIINTGLEFVAPGAMAVMPGFAKTGSKMASDLALAGKMASGGRFGSKAANLSDLKDVGLQFLQEGFQGGVTERAAEGARANAFNDKIDYGGVLKSAALEAAAGGIIGGASQMASGGTSRRRAQDAVKEVQSRREQYSAALNNAKAERQRLSEIRNQRPLTEDENIELSAATMEEQQARAAISEIDKMMSEAGLQNPGQPPAPQSTQEEGRSTPEPAAGQPDITQNTPPEPASGLSGVVQRAQTSTAPNLATVLSEAIASGQTPDFSALAQAYSRTRAEVVGLFNRRRTLVDLADAGDLNGMRDMAARMTADPQEQQSLIEQAVAVRDKRRAMASQPQPTQQAEPQQPATPIKTPRDTAYEKMLADAEASLASGASDVDTFLAVRKKYAGNKDLVDTDINGVIDDAKASLSGKREAAAKREAAIESAIPHLKAGDEVSAVTALADAGISGDADIQAALKEASGRIKAEQKASAAPKAPAEPAAPAKSPMEQAVSAVSAAEASGKGVKLATIAKKFGVGIADLAEQVVKSKRAQANTRQPEEDKPKQAAVLALPAPPDAPIPADQPLVSRRGKLMPKPQADAMDEQSAAEKRDMRRAMSEEAGNPTGVPTGMRPRVETPARAPQKAVLPDVILRTDGKPFPNEAEATRAMNRKGAQETHEVAPAPHGAGVVIKRKKANTIDVEKDDILAAIAKSGGVNWDQARKQGGFDPAESGRRGSGILRVFKKNGGMTLDGMAEHLSQFGYPVTDENGDYTVNALLDAMDTALRGGQVGTAQFNERLAREMYEQEAELRALDDALDGGSSSDMPSWLDDGADALAESVIDGETQPSAVLADALNEVENERTIASPTAGTGQKAESGAEAGAGQGSNAPTAGPREGGQQEGKGGAGQDSGVQAGFQLTAQTEAERLAEEQRQAADIEAKRKEEEKARLKAQADREISSFTLTGSDRPADVAMAAGQKDLFAPRTRGEKEAEKAAKNTYAERNADRIRRIGEATTKDQVAKIVAEEESDPERHFEGTSKVSNAAHTRHLGIDSAKRAENERAALDRGEKVDVAGQRYQTREDAERAAREKNDEGDGYTYEPKVISDEDSHTRYVLTKRKAGSKERITPASAGDMKAGDIIKTSNGDEYVAMRARHDFMDAHPIVDGKPVVNRDSTVRFHLNPNTASAYPERNHAPVYKTGRNQYEEPVREMTEEGRAKDGKPIIGGDKFRTSSGRETTPYPHQKSEKYASQWLIDNATAEAEARGDDFNAPIFRRTTLLKNGMLAGADRDSMLMYLFGEQPKVVPSILKPLISDLERAQAIVRQPASQPITEQEQALLQREAEKQRAAAINLMTAGESMKSAGIEFEEDGPRTRITRNGIPIGSLEGRRDRETVLRVLQRNHGEQPQSAQDNIRPMDSQKKGEGEPLQVSPNKVFTEDAAAKAREILRKALLGNKPMSGMDPELFQAGVTLAGYHIEKGARTFAAYAKAMLSDLGESVRPYLKSWYMGVKYDPRASEMSGMSTASEVDGFDVGSVSIAPAVGIDSLQDYVVSEIEKNIKSLYPDGNAPKSVLEVESTDYSIDLVLQNHPAVRGRRDDPRAYKDFADAAKGIDKGAIREKIIGQREIEPFKAWQPATLKEENREVQGNDQYSGGGQKGDSARHEPSTGQRVVLAEQRPVILSDGQAGRPSGEEVGSEQEGGARLPVDSPADAGKQGDQSIHREDGQFQPENGFAGDSEPGGRSGRSDSRVHAERSGRPAVIRIAEQSGTDQLTTKRKLQRDAESIPVVVGDRENIDKTLPFLMDGQREDVHKAELRFSAKNGNGMLFTNGTGTGKTFLGLGIAKRFDRTGKGSGLIVVPNDEVMNEWVSSAPDLGLKITPLNDTKDKGDGIAITTYANLGQNDAISHRNYDFVIADEAHNLMQNADAEDTSALLAFRAITLHDSAARTLTDMRNRDLVNRRKYLNGAISSNNRIINNQDTMDYMVDDLRKENAIMEAELNKLNGEYDQKLKDTQDAIRTSAKPKAVFLSATPFAYEKNIRWAQGYLFDWNEGKQDENSSVRPYNAGSNYEQFMMQHFGYRMRYNKLTEPDAKVDRDLMQRQFNSYLKKSGSLSSRMLDVPSDYQRAFALTPNAIGTKIDEGLNWLREADDGRYRPIYDIVNERFDYLSRQRLLEAMKAQAVIPMIEQWHKIGKKVVVFYDFNSGGGFSPFDVGTGSDEKVVPGDGSEPIPAKDLLAEFYAKRPDLKAINTGSLSDPLTAIRGAYPDAGVVNGLENRRNRNSALKDFNDDSKPDANLLLVQSAINAGWSAHDKSGKFKRVLINLGLPTAPTKAIQQEGRIYRQGQHPESDSMFVYLNTGTAWERIAFANTIANRASTAENLAMGESARGLKDAFIMAFEESDHLTPSTNEGKGSKARDRSLVQAISQFDRAKSYYFGTQKNSKARNLREGSDYYATPEPVGLKMVEWLGLGENERALEPSAGHGAISRWLPDGTKNTIIEPSFDLLSRAALNTNAKQINGDFESLHLTNKFEGIVMNPPFGRGGSTAIEHLDKAFKHLSDNGRIVALIPRGGMADKRFAAWYEGIDSKGKQEHPDAVLRANILLPEVTFERAGTKVSTRIVVIDKITDESLRAESGHQKQVDLSNASDIGDLFDRINDIAVPPRMKSKPQVSADNGRTDGAGGALIATAETTHAIKKIPLYVAKMTRRVSADSYASLNAVAKRFGGYYSRYEKNGAIPGFQFESEDSRQKFIDAIGDQGQYGTPPSSPTPGVAEVSETGEYITSVGGQNERDTSSVQSRKRAYGSHSAAAHDDLFAASAVPASESEAERNRTDFSKHFSTVSENLEQGRVKSPERITGHKEAAALFARWKDFSQERFLVAGLDANNKVVEVAVHTVGLKASASVDPGTVAGMVARNPSIKSVWLAHNHPSGSSAKSAADAQITRAISDLISAAGISVDGHIILGADSYTVLDSDGEALSRIPGMGEFDYQAAPATASVPLVDRMITKRDPGTKITGPDSAKKYVVDKGASGIVLMDTQLNVVGFWEMTLEQMGQMRQNQDSTRSLMAAIDASNAFNAIVSVPDEMADGGTAWKNVAAMLAASQISVVDAIGYKTGGSYASLGLQVDQKGRKFYSATADTSGPGLTTSRAREILAADPVLSKALPFIDIRNSKDGVPEGAEPFGEEGYYHNGRITLFADNIRATGSMSAEERLKWVAFHEITHRGVANLAESQAYLSELERAGKNPYVKNLAKKIYEARQELDEKYHVSMEVAAEEALAEINAALRTGNVKQIKEQYGLHFPLSIRPRAKSAAARFIEAVKRIINRMFGRGLTDAQVENLLRRTNDAGITPDGGPGRGRDYDAAVYSLADKGDGSPTEAALAEARRQLDEQLAIADRMIADRGGLFAPNGEKSKLSRYQWAQVRTENFKRWFGDWENDPASASKAVDGNGEPMVVYHGTTAMGFNEFKPKSAEAYGLGSYFASDRTMPEEEFGVDGRVIEAFLNIRNPSDGSMPEIRKNSEALKKLRQSRPRFRGDEYDAFEEYGDFRGEAIREAGHDGIIAENDEYETELVVFKPNQIKSAIGNAGTFSGKTNDIRYSPSPKDWITEQGRITKRVLSKEVAQRDLTPWQKTLGTQLNAALKNPAFKKVYDLTQRLIQHVNNDAYDSLNAAPDVLSRLEDWNDYKRDIANTAKEAGAALTLQQSKRRKDMAAAAEVLFEGTRFDKKVYSDAELDAFKLTADQKEIYRQARAAIDKSVGNAGKSQALNVAMNAEAINWATVERLVNLDLDPEVLFSEVSDLIDARIAATKMEAENSTNEAEIKKLDKQAEKLAAALASIGEIQSIVEKSATEGYAPLMRWGKYTVAVIDPVDGKTLRFHMLESKREQAALELQLREKYGVANVVGGVLDEGKFEQFKGITPETVALFASVTGMDQDAAYQEYLKLAIPGRSALKRKIHRKGDMGEGIEGFSTDLPRVLSSFVLSNARKSARDLYRGPINDAIKGIKVGGGVAAKARELAEFVLEPDENDWSVGIRNMLFVWNMGASVAFGVLNLSQPWMMTLPWLSQFQDPASAAGVMAKAAKLAASAQASGKAPKGYEAEYSRAVREGIVDPQNVFMLQGVERGKSGVGTNIWRNVAHGMGLIASATESMNRKLTLIAALDVARAKGDAWLKSKGFADAYDFAARAVAETQGVYNKGNRPAWARNPALAVILVFKQYSINWVEMASRMASNHYGDDRYRKGFWMLVGALFMMAGGMGLPFADDLIDLIESGMSWAGKPVNVERQMQMALGKDLYEPLMNGPVNSLLFNPMGADMFGRMSMGNMIPATAVANPGLTWAARSDEAVQALGAGAGLASKFVDAYNQAASGNVGQALITASPRAVTSIAKAVEMATTNQYKDSKGRTVRSVTPAEALIKGLDLQPASVARIQRERGRRFKDEAIQAQAKETIRNALIDAYESGDQDAIEEANARLRDWNDENPLYPVHINRRALRKTVRERGKNWSARDEAAKGMEWMNDWIPESSK